MNLITLGELIAGLLNGITPLNFIIAFVAGVVGMLLMFTIKYDRHGKHNPETPENFSWRYWLVDNTVRLIRNILTISVFIVFSQALAGVELSTAFAFLVGLGLEKAIELLRNIGSNFPNKKP